MRPMVLPYFRREKDVAIRASANSVVLVNPVITTSSSKRPDRALDCSIDSAIRFVQEVTPAATYWEVLKVSMYRPAVQSLNDECGLQ